MLKLTAFESSRTDLAPEPINPAWIREGSPVARSVILSQSPDGRLLTGLWDCTAGVFTWIYPADEIVQILEGEVRVTDSAGTRVLGPGSVCYFPHKLETVWEVPKYVKKTFILRFPHRSLPRRAASFAKRMILRQKSNGGASIGG